jgi:hypothetical protein
MGRGEIEYSTVRVSFRTANYATESTKEWAAAGVDELAAADPWRTFRWCLGQKHYSGFPPRLIGVAGCCCR